MPLVKVSLLFEHVGYGWSESWIYEVPSDTFDPSTDADKLASERLLMAADPVKIMYLRITRLNQLRTVKVIPYGITGSQSNPLNPQDCFVAKHFSATPNRIPSIREYRGIPRSIVKSDGTLEFTPAFVTRWARWNNFLANQPWGWLGEISKVKLPIKTLTQAVSGQVTITTDTDLFPAGTFPRNVKVFVSGVIGACGLGGNLVGLAIDTKTFVTNKAKCMRPYLGGGFITYGTRAFVPAANNAQQIRLSERKPGRPSYLSAGRRRTVRCCG